MNLASRASPLSFRQEDVQRLKEPNIHLQFDPIPCSPEVVYNNLASIEGPLDVYCWYEGPQCLPQLGANFMREAIFKPLYERKRDAKLCLYSLKAWDFKKNVVMMPFTPLGEAINRINSAAIECIYSSSFFQYCTEIRKESGIYEYLNEELLKKGWLFSLSKDQRKKGMTVGELLNDKMSLFDCIKDLDVSAAYSPMQYVEGYYLIQESVRKALLNGQKKIQIAFVLPNDESKYYLDYPQDIQNMLQLDFGKDISDIDINISFQFFKYGDSPKARPYIDKGKKAPKVESKDLASYFDYLSKPSVSSEQTDRPFPKSRDAIHNLNGMY